MADYDRILRECKTLTTEELDAVMLFIGYLKFRAATEEDSSGERKLDRSDA